MHVKGGKESKGENEHYILVFSMMLDCVASYVAAVYLKQKNKQIKIPLTDLCAHIYASQMLFNHQ